MLTVRAAELEDVPGIARVHVDAWQAAYAGILPQAYLDQLTVQNRTMTWVRILERSAPHLITLVSEDHNRRIVGFVSAGQARTEDPRFGAEITSLYVMPGFQRKGHGRRLFMAAADRLAKRKMNGLLVWVLAENPARGFYETVGGKPMTEITRSFAGKPLREVGYGWETIPTYE
jgi:ribosomal protein S18 acetylase RimI-like enzyme